MDSRRLGRVHIIDTNRQPEKCIFGSGCTIAEALCLVDVFAATKDVCQDLSGVVMLGRRKARYLAARFLTPPV